MSTDDRKNIEKIKFEVSKNQLIGDPWDSTMGGKMQNIVIADGWYIARPVEKLHETENGKIAFYLAKYKKDGGKNEITLRRSRRLEETDGNGKPIFKQEKMTVSIEELKDIEKYGKEKYRYQKTVKDKQKAVKTAGKEDRQLPGDGDYPKSLQEINKVRFEVVETKDINEPFAVMDNETGTMLKTEENLPYKFFTKARADAFAKDANELAQDGLKIRFHKDKAYALCKIAVKQNGLALAFLRNQTMELALDAVRQNSNAIVAVSERYREKIARQMPEMLFNKMLRGEVAQDEVINELLALDDKLDYAIYIVTEEGKQREIRAMDINMGISKAEDGISIYTVGSGECRITFTDVDIGEVQYKDFVAAYYDTSQKPLAQEVGIRPRSRVR